jgi:hypothetical protein
MNRERKEKPSIEWMERALTKEAVIYTAREMWEEMES